MVRLGRDAVRPAPLPVRARAERFEQRFPADFICEAQDQTRGWFYSLLAVATLLGEPPPYRNVVCLGLILDEEGQKMSKSQGQHGRAVAGARHATARTRFAGTSSPPSSRGTAIASPRRRSARACGCSSSSCGARTTSTRSTRSASRRAAGCAGAGSAAKRRRASATSTAGRCRARRRPPSWWPSAWRPTTRRPPAGRSRSSWRSSPTGTCAARAGASGTAIRRRSRPCAACLLTVAKLLAPFCPFIADEIYDNLDGTLASVHLCDFPDRPPSVGGARRASSSRRWRSRARRCASGWARAGRPRSRCASRWARRSSSPTAASARRSSGWPRSCARS